MNRFIAARAAVMPPPETGSCECDNPAPEGIPCDDNAHSLGGSVREAGTQVGIPFTLPVRRQFSRESVSLFGTGASSLPAENPITFSATR